MHMYTTTHINWTQTTLSLPKHKSLILRYYVHDKTFMAFANILGSSHLPTTFVFNDAKSWPLLVNPPSIITSYSQYAWTHISNRPHLLHTCKSSCCQTAEATCCALFLQGFMLASLHVHLLSYPTNITRIEEDCIYFLYGRKIVIFKNIIRWRNHTSIFLFLFLV